MGTAHHYPRPYTPSDEAACTPGEHTCADEAYAHRSRRVAINAGLRVSLIGLDPARDVYAWDVYAD